MIYKKKIIITNYYSHGGAYIIPSPAFSAREAVKAVDKEKCTALYGTPTMFVDVLNLPELKNYNLTSLSTGYMAGAPCPQSLVKAVVNDLHMKDFVVCTDAVVYPLNKLVFNGPSRRSLTE